MKYTFGGKSTKGKRKIARTLLPKKWVHLCLKSKKAMGSYSLLHKQNRSKIEGLIRRKAKENHIELRDAVNMGNHLHLKIRSQRKEDFQRFLRSISGQIARIATGAKKGKKFGKFWDGIAFTRVLMTAFEELQLKGYFRANRIEQARGYQARTKFLDEFNLWVRRLKQPPVAAG